MTLSFVDIQILNCRNLYTLMYIIIAVARDELEYK